LSPLLRTSSGPGRAARADFIPRAPGPRGGDASLAKGCRVAPSVKDAAASTSFMGLAAPPPLQTSLAAAAALGTGLMGAVSPGVTLGSATPLLLSADAAQQPPRRRSSTGGFGRLGKKKVPTDLHRGVDVIMQSTSTGQRLNMPPFENSRTSLTEFSE